MLLRISLIVAIIASIGAIVVGQWKLREHISTIIVARDTFERERNQERVRANKAENELKDTREELAATQKSLTETKDALAMTTSRLDQEQERASRLSEELTSTKQKLNATDQELSAFRALGVPVEQILAMMEELRKVKTANEAIEEEKQILARQVRKLKNDLELLVGKENYQTPLPAGLKGKVLVVDPKWDFVVLDVGEKENVLKGGIMMVSRDGKLVGKVKIASVQPERSIANVVPGWELTDIMEGDEVLY